MAVASSDCTEDIPGFSASLGRDMYEMKLVLKSAVAGRTASGKLFRKWENQYSKTELTGFFPQGLN